MTEIEEPRIRALEGRFENLDKHVGKLSEVVAGVVTTQDAQTAMLRDISEKVNKPPAPTNWWAMIGAVVSVVGLMGAYVALRVEPISAAMTSFSGSQTAHSVMLAERGVLLGRMEYQAQDNHEEIEALNEVMAALMGSTRKAT